MPPAALTGYDFIQGAVTHGPTNYGGRFGINYAFNSAAPLITKY